MDGKIPEHTLHLEYSVSRQQIDELKRLVLRTNLAGMKWREWAKVATWGLVLAALMFVRADGAWRRLIWAGGAAAFYVAFVFLVNRSHDRNSPDGMSGEAEVGPAGIWFRAPNSTSLLSWSGISHFMETPDVFVLVRRKQQSFHILPKRAFASETEVSWFREALEASVSGRPIPEVPPKVRLPEPPAEPADAVSLETRYRLRDAIALRRASWRLPAFILMVLGAIGFGTGFVMVQDWRSGIVRDLETPLLGTMGMIPILAGAAVVFVLLSWWSAGEMRRRFAITLTDTGIALESLAGKDEIPWERFTHFKEISSHFFVWRRGSQAWITIPKHPLTPAQVSRVRKILATKLKRSTWFWG